MKKLLVCLLLAVSLFSIGCAGSGTPPRWTSADMQVAAAE